MKVMPIAIEHPAGRGSARTLARAVRDLGAALHRLVAERSRRWSSCARGSTAIEFATLAPLYVGPILAGFALGVVLLARAQLDQAALAGMRAVQTGNATTQSQLQTAICGAIGGLLGCSNVMINLDSYTSLAAMNTSTPTLTYNANGTVSNTWSMSFGSPGSIMVLQLMYQFPIIGGPLLEFATQSNGSLLLASTQVFIEE